MFDYRTGEFGPKHPDFDPILFAQCALAFFDQNRSNPVETLRQDWGSESVSAWQYWKYRMDGCDKKDCAKRVTGGKFAKELGFSTLMGEVEEGTLGNVALVWKRD